MSIKYKIVRAAIPPDDSLTFEYAVRTFLGEDAYGIADCADDPKLSKKFWKRVLRKIYKRVERLDTTSKHKEIVFSRLERVEKSLGTSQNPYSLTSNLFSLIGILLGFIGLDGKVKMDSFYFQTPFDKYNSEATQDKTSYEISKDYRKNTIHKQKELIKLLRQEGYDTFKISLVLNTSEYMVKKIIRGI